MPTTDVSVESAVISFFTLHCFGEMPSVAVAFSGGSDSVALLHSLYRTIGPSRLVAFYVNHHLRTPSELSREIQLNKQTCTKLGVKLEILDLGEGAVAQAAATRGSGIEEAARFLRYNALVKACKDFGCSVLATAHNADDQLETLLMRFFNGTSPVAMSGIKPYRKNFSEGITLIRPVLEFSHNQLKEYVLQAGLEWSEDSTNESGPYLRNTIRHSLTKNLVEVFPDAYHATSVFRQKSEELSDWFESLLDEAVKNVQIVGRSASFDLDFFLQLPPTVKDGLLYRIHGLLVGDDLQQIRYTFLQRIRTELEGGKSIDSWEMSSGKHLVALQFCKVHWSYDEPIHKFCIPLDTNETIQEIRVGELVFNVQKATEDADPLLLRIDSSKLDKPLLRSFREGDQIELEGRRESLANLFSQWKIPKYQQPSVPVLCDRSGVVAVFGRTFGGRDRLAHRYKGLLAGRMTNIYSSNKRNESSEIEK